MSNISEEYLKTMLLRMGLTLTESRMKRKGSEQSVPMRVARGLFMQH